MSRSRSNSPGDRSFENERNEGGGRGGFGGGFGGGRGGPPRSDDLFSIKVDGMSLRTNKDDVRAKFERFGEIGDIFFPSDKHTGSSRGFCFVRFYKEDARDDSLDHYRDGFTMDDKTVRIEKASTRPRPGADNWDPDRRGRGGGRGGDRFGGGGRSFGDRDRSFGGGRNFDGPPPRSRAENMYSLKVMDMTLTTTKDDVREVFDKFGEIGDLFFPPDRDTGASRGFCYVRYFKRDDCEDALDEYGRNGVDIDGQRCHVEKAQPRGGGPDSGRGGRGGGFDRFNRGGDRGGDRGFGGGRRLDRFDERDRYDDRRGGRGRDSRSPPRRRDDYRRSRSRSPPRRRERSPRDDYDRYRRRSPLRSRSRSPYRR